MKKILLFFFSCLLLTNCMDKIDKRNVNIINNSLTDVYCLISQTDSFKNSYTQYSPESFDQCFKVRKDSICFIADKPRDWGNYIAYCNEGKMRIFIISKDSIDKYGWEKVLDKNIYTIVYKLDIEDLDSCKWQIIYK